MEAAKTLATADRGATLRELAAHAHVGATAARYTVSAMKKRGALVIVRTRRVPYRNRPVAEYALPSACKPLDTLASAALAAAFSSWHSNPSPSP